MPRGYSIHVGLDSVDPAHYEGWGGGFTSCEADARSHMELAQMQKFASQILLGRDATREAVIRAIGRVAELTYENDSVFVSFAGASGWLTTCACARIHYAPGDRTWCLYNGQVLGSELYELLARFRSGVRVLVVSDTCAATPALEQAYRELARLGALGPAYAGVDVAHPPRFRTLPAEISERCSQTQRERYAAIAMRLPKRPPPITASVQFMLACLENQLAADGPEHGLLTAALIGVWSKGSFPGNLRDLVRTVVSRMPPTQSPLLAQLGASDPDFQMRRPFER